MRRCARKPDPDHVLDVVAVLGVAVIGLFLEAVDRLYIVDQYKYAAGKD